MNRIKLWPHAVLIVVAFAAIAAVATALWIRYERSAEAKALPNAARIERVNGQVGVNQSLDTSSPQKGANHAPLAATATVETTTTAAAYRAQATNAISTTRAAARDRASTTADATTAKPSANCAARCAARDASAKTGAAAASGTETAGTAKGA